MPVVNMRVLRSRGEGTMWGGRGSYQQERSSGMLLCCVVYKLNRRVCDQIGEIVLRVVVTMHFIHALIADVVVIVFGVSDKSKPSVPAFWNVFYARSSGFLKSILVKVLSDVSSLISRLLSECGVGAFLRSRHPALRSAVSSQTVVDRSVVVDVVSGEIGGARWTADRCVNEGVGEEDPLVSNHLLGVLHWSQSTQHDVLIVGENEHDVVLRIATLTAAQGDEGKKKRLRGSVFFPYWQE